MNFNVKPKISCTIRDRIKATGKRFFACDNISDFIANDEELRLLLEEVTDKFKDVLDTLLIDTDNDPNSQETPRRLAKMYLFEIMNGRYVERPKATAFPNVNDEEDEKYDGMIVVRAEIKSLCAHHHKDITGTAYIGIIPNGKVLGLSKYIRIAQWCSRRGTLQEVLTKQISKEIKAASECENVAVYIEAEHACCTMRGVQAHSALTQTICLSGLFHDPAVKDEFYRNINMQENIK